MPAYSKTPLYKKLGLQDGMAIAIHQAPANYFDLLAPVDEKSLSVDTEPIAGSLDFVHLFVENQADLEAIYLHYKHAIKRDGMMWISWPKGSSGIATDLKRDWIRAYGLDNGLVDVKIASINDLWSGLKFVYRLVDRQAI